MNVKSNNVITKVLLRFQSIYIALLLWLIIRAIILLWLALLLLFFVKFYNQSYIYSAPFTNFRVGVKYITL